MIYGSVCSGIEAATVAWHPLGWQAAWYSEIEKFPAAALAHHYPETPNLGDMTQIHKKAAFNESAIDVLVGGTPCQSFSVAGLRGGLDDDRGNLALHFCKLARQARARWVVWENVPGVLSSGSGRDFGAIVGALVELGYGVCWRVLDAQFVRVQSFRRAVPQRRRRVFVVGYLGDWRPAAAVLFEPESLSGNPAPIRKAGQRIAAILTSGAGTGSKPSGRRQEDDVNIVKAYRTTGNCGVFDTGAKVDTLTTSTDPNSHLVAFAQNSRNELRLEGGDGQVVGALSTGGGKPGQGLPVVAGTLESRGATGGYDPGAHGAASGHLIPEYAKPLKAKSNDSHDATHDTCIPDVAWCLQERDAKGSDSDTKQGHLIPTAFKTSHLSQNGQIHSVGVSPTLDIGSGAHGVQVRSTVRRLTPTECERLQGFPDGYTAIPYRGKPADKCPDGPRYRALGNSMAVNVMRWIGERIQQFDAIR